jgi:hypothetical protein
MCDVAAWVYSPVADPAQMSNIQNGLASIFIADHTHRMTES